MPKKQTEQPTERIFGTSHWVVEKGAMYCAHCDELHKGKARKWMAYSHCRYCPDCGFEMEENKNEQ